MDRKVAPELYELSKVVPKHFVKKAPKGKYGQYVPHYVVVQRLLATVGPYDWELVEVLRGDSRGTVKDKDIDLHDVIVGVVYRLTVVVDGHRVSIEEVGEVDAYTKTGDGARLKHATSDALKRCARRLGVAIQLWCKTPDDHFLPAALNTEDTDTEEVVVGGEDVDEPDSLSRPVAVPNTTPPPDTWNQLLATLENLPAVTDMKPVWLKHAKQLTGRMILAGMWKETDTKDLTKLDKKALVETVTKAHKTATKTAVEQRPF